MQVVIFITFRYNRDDRRLSQPPVPRLLLTCLWYLPYRLYWCMFPSASAAGSTMPILSCRSAILSCVFMKTIFRKPAVR